MSDELSDELIEVDGLLRRAASAFRYPPTPAIAAAVRARLVEERQPVAWPAGILEAAAGWLARPALRAAVVASAAALLVVGTVLAVPRSREAVAEFFGLRHVRVEVLPTPAPSSTPLPTLSPGSFARPVTLDEAQRAAAFPLRFPTREGLRLEPEQVYLFGAGPDATVIFTYGREGFDLYQSTGSLFGKGAPEPGSYQELQFSGHPAYWFPEGGHVAQFLDERGRPIGGTRRAVDRATLLWEANDITYRLETTLSQQGAIRLAESLQ